VLNSAPLPGFAGEEKPANTLYRNRGNGTFEDVTKQAGVGDKGYGLGGCAGDYDNDGNVDLYATNFGRNILYRNSGDGTFADMTERAGVGDSRLSTSAAFSDIDNDGDLDLYVANNVRISLEQSGGCLQGEVPVYCAPTAYEGESGILYRNEADGTFVDITQSAGVYNTSGRQLGVVFGDYDDDGDSDLYVANDMTPNFLYRNDGGARFKEVGLVSGTALNESARPEAGMGTDFGDWDGDGDMDLVVCNFQWESCRLYDNEGGGSFLDVTAASGLAGPTLSTLTFGTLFFDHDNDGDLDLYLANGHVHPQVEKFEASSSYAQRDQLFSNNGDGRFSAVRAGSGMELARVGRGAAVADYDNDGDVDVFVSNNNQRPLLLRNDSDNRNHWLTIKTVGTSSNRDGIGAKIRIVVGGRVQVEEVRSGSSYLSQDDLRVHFGLGTNTQVDRIEIRWPSGIEQTVAEVPADQILVVKEPMAESATVPAK
jgi:hypothetical protein